MTTPYVMYSENGCLLCREAEGTLRLLLGNRVFNRYFSVVKMTFRPELLQDFQQVSGSATIPKLYRGDFRSGEQIAGSFDEIMALIASGEIYRLAGQTPKAFPAEESADALIVGAGPGGLAAFQKLKTERGRNPLVITETVGGKLSAMARGAGTERFLSLSTKAPGWTDNLRPGIEVDGIQIEGDSKTISAGNRVYRTKGPLVLAMGISIQHFDLQVELDFLDQCLGYRAAWNDVRNRRVTVYAMRGQADQAYAAAQQLSKQNNDVTVVSPSPLRPEQLRVLNDLFLVSVVEGRVEDVITEGTPPRIVAVKSGEQTIPTDWLLWNEPFRSRGKSLYKAAFGTDWLRVDPHGRVLNDKGAVVPGVYGVGDGLENSDKSLDAVFESAARLDFAL